jgi:hypothetical protein
MIEFALSISLSVIEPIVNHPKPLKRRIHIDATDQTDALDHTVLIPAILSAT